MYIPIIPSKQSTATVLKKSGVPVHDIMPMTGHRNVSSMSLYAEGPTLSDRAKMPSILANYGKVENARLKIMKILVKNHWKDLK